MTHPRIARFAFALALCALPSAAHAIEVYESPEGDVSFGIGGYVQPYFRWVQDPCAWSSDADPVCKRSPVPDGFGLSRARIVLEGDYAERGQFKLELRTIPNVELLEAQLSFNPIERLRISVGRFKVPFSRQELTSESRLEVGRADYSRSMPGRQLGLSAAVQAGPSSRPDLVVLSAGLFNGESDNERAPVNNIDSNFLGAARLEIAPLGLPPNEEGDLRDAAARRHLALVLGGAMTYETRAPESDNYRQQNMAGDLTVKWHGVSLFGEFFRYDRDYNDDVANADKHGVGVTTQLGVFIPAPYLREHLELVARYQIWDPDTARDADRAPELVPTTGGSGPANTSGTQGRTSLDAGANWYFFGHDLKLQFFYTHRHETEGYARSLSTAPGVGSVTDQVHDDSFIAQLSMRL